MELYQHQKQAIDHFFSNIQRQIKGLYLFHDVGTGKTLTSLYIAKQCLAEQTVKHIVIITTSSVLNQFKEEAKKVLGTKNQTFKFKAYNSFKFHVKLDNPKNTLLIMDEAHKLRNVGTISKNILNICEKSKYLLFLSATPFVNSPFDIARIANTLRDKVVFPLTKTLFENRFLAIDKSKPYQIAVQNENEFKEKTKHLFSLHTTIERKYRNKEGFARLFLTDKFVNMIPKQYELHEKIKSKTLTKQNLENITNKYHFSLKPTKSLNSFLSQTRQLSNIIKGQPNIETEKISKLSAHLQNENRKFPIIVYSDFLGAGLFPILKQLKNNANTKNLNIELFTGLQPQQTKKDLIRKYNDKKVDILLLSGAGSEGIDLKRTQEIHIMEPHWNQMRIEQVIGRGWRKKAHNNNIRKELHIFKWYTIHKNIRSADQILLDLTQFKNYKNKLFIKLL